MLDFISNIIFRHRLSGLDGEPGVSKKDADILIQGLELRPDESEEVEKFCSEASESLYIPTSKIKSFIQNLPIPENQVSLYGAFRNLFGADVDWGRYFPALDSKRSQVLEAIYQRLYDANGKLYVGAQVTDVNGWMNSKGHNPELYSVGLNCYLFRRTGSIVCGEATSDIKPMPRTIEGKEQYVEHRMLMFDTIFDEKCLESSGCEFDLAKFDSLYTLAIFSPRVKEYLARKFDIVHAAINTIGVVSGMPLVSLTLSNLFTHKMYEQVVGFLATHEWSHVITDRVESDTMSLSGYLKYKDDPGEKGEVVRKMFEMMYVGKEVMPDLLAINYSSMFPLLYSLIRFAGSSVSMMDPPSKFASIMMTGVSPFTFSGFSGRSDELLKFFSTYRDSLIKVILDQIVEWIKANDKEKVIGDRVETLCTVSSGGQEVDICSDKFIEDEIFYTILAEYFWSDVFPSDPSVLKNFIKEKWKEYQDIQRDLREPQ